MRFKYTTQDLLRSTKDSNNYIFDSSVSERMKEVKWLTMTAISIFDVEFILQPKLDIEVHDESLSVLNGTSLLFVKLKT